jgi:hypothetical protein
MNEMMPNTLGEWGRQLAAALEIRGFKHDAQRLRLLFRTLVADIVTREEAIQKGVNIATELARQLRAAEARIEELEKDRDAWKPWRKLLMEKETRIEALEKVASIARRQLHKLRAENDPDALELTDALAAIAAEEGSMFKKGMRVRAILHGAGVVTEEERIVLRVDRDGVWLDNGVGNDPSGPFIDGKRQGVFGFWEEIIPLAAEEKPNA